MKIKSSDLIVGVEREIIEKFLILIKEKYPLVDKANYFLERLGVSGINIAMANQRDVLSHLCTILADTDLDHQGKLDQLSTAEEHLRRAIIESYQKGVALKLKNVFKLHEEYKHRVIPIQKRHSVLSSAPNNSSIRASLKEIEDLRGEGRAIKARNKWDEKWEDGITLLLEAFIKTEELEQILEEYLLRTAQIMGNKKQLFWTYLGIISTITTFILGGILFFR